MRGQRFGGPWTEDKLRRVEAYLLAYATALKDQPFDLMYVDAFAGTGFRSKSQRDTQPSLALEEFRDTDEYAKGSARLALEVEPPFDRYVFIEKNRRAFGELTKIIDDYPQRASAVSFLNKDANGALTEICDQTNWWRTRAVVFLDPYGMQVDWSMIERLAATEAIDLWYLFPAYIGVGRMIPHTGTVPATWQARLDRCLGDEGWRQAFYAEEQTGDLFDNSLPRHERRFSIAGVESYFRTRLATVFAGVSTRTAELRNQRGTCMYLLFFACANERGAPIALRIAEHILRS